MVKNYMAVELFSLMNAGAVGEKGQDLIRDLDQDQGLEQGKNFYFSGVELILFYYLLINIWIFVIFEIYVYYFEQLIDNICTTQV